MSTSHQLFALPLQHPPHIVQARLTTHASSGTPITESYLLPRLWCMHLYFYEARIQFGDHQYQLTPGCVTIAAPNTPLHYHYTNASTHLFTHFTLEPTQGPETALTRAYFDPEEIGPEFVTTLERVVAGFGLATPHPRPNRAEVGLWELLWQLAEKTPQPTPQITLHPSLEKALRLIEERLATPPTISALAHEVGLSHNQLTRLFVAHTGKTIVAYIRHRRAERARYLLQNSTLSISAIAAQVGVPVLGQFNHLMRRETGISPRRLRSSEF